MVRSRFGEICSCCSLSVLPGPAWALLNYVLRTILCTSVGESCKQVCLLTDRLVVVVECEERGDGGDLEELGLHIGEERLIALIFAPLATLLQVVPGTD